jgi:hypothetical protein
MAVAGIINTGSHPRALWPGVHAFWGQVYDEYPEEYPDLFQIEDSDKNYELDVQITGFGIGVVKDEGGPIEIDSEIQGPTTQYAHIAYGLGYIVTFEELRDNQYEYISMRRAEANAFSCRQTLELLGAGIYNDLFTGAVFLGGDGVSLINTAHPLTTGGTFSNQLTPNADLMEASLEDMSIQIWGFQTDRNLNIAIREQSLHVPKNEFYNANRIMKSVLQSGTANNDINVLKATNAYPGGIKMNHYFNNPHAWFVRTTARHGMMMFWRDRPMFWQDNDGDTKNAKAAFYFRCSFGGTDPRGIAGSNGP